MSNRQNNNLNSDEIDLLNFFNEPVSERQKQYEAVRAFIKERVPAQKVAEKFNYKTTTVYALVRDAKAGKLNLFPEIKRALSSGQHLLMSKIKSSVIENRIYHLLTYTNDLLMRGLRPLQGQ